MVEVVPNPIKKSATIRYAVLVSGKVAIKLYNATGCLVKTLKNEYHHPGIYTITLLAQQLGKGIYFLKYQDNTNQKALKLIVE
ncbi:MAG: T9SS type A sorting domain-containing protein, partial [candidate division WOR-3 bacterium]|nr:T9SS type A sorting domain-containing protein [candidate division WOR-3 bacterium]